MGIEIPWERRHPACLVAGPQPSKKQARMPALPGQVCLNQRSILCELTNQTNSFHRVTIKHSEVSREVRRFNSVAKINNRHLAALDPLRRAKHPIARRACGHHLDVKIPRCFGFAQAENLHSSPPSSISTSLGMSVKSSVTRSAIVV